MRALVLALALSTTLSAQTADAPTLTEEQLLRISVIELRAENISLKMAALQAEFAKLQGEATSYLRSLEKPGYRLEKQNDKWVYTEVKK
jgi:hypothetical protein